MWGLRAANHVAFETKTLFDIYNSNLPYPAPSCILTAVDSNDDTVVALNISNLAQHRALTATVTLSTQDAIADSGATQIFVMEGTPVHNKQPKSNPALGLLANLKKTREIKWASQVKAASIMSVVKE